MPARPSRCSGAAVGLSNHWFTDAFFGNEYDRCSQVTANIVNFMATNSASMKTNSESSGASEFSRREFLTASAAAAVAGPFVAGAAFAQGQAVSPGETLRVGLVGCGGRGTGAAAQALAADSNVKLVAMGDAFKERLELSLETLKKQQDIAAKIEVSEEK